MRGDSGFGWVKSAPLQPIWLPILSPSAVPLGKGGVKCPIGFVWPCKVDVANKSIALMILLP
jgi:hypothetical protein